MSDSNRDYVQELFQLMETANGREKAARFVQFVAKFLKWSAESQAKPDKAEVEKWTALMGSMAHARKIMRFVRVVPWVRATLNSASQVAASPSKLTFELLLENVSRIGLTTYFLFDHMLYFNQMKLWKPAADVVARVDRIATLGWLADVVSQILLSCYRLQRLGNNTSQTEQQIQQLRQQYIRTLVRNLLDFPVVLHVLGMTGTHPHGHFGILGAMSSLISLYELWPVVKKA